MSSSWLFVVSNSCQYFNVNYRGYKLRSDQKWEIDLVELEKLIDENTAPIVVNNPSNPCGSNFSRSHVEAIVAFAEKHKIPIIADEIYADMVFQGNTFTSMASVSENVPLIVCGGLAKRFLIPGWRVGWLSIQDRNDVFKRGNIRQGIKKISQTILGACSLAQAVVPYLLREVPQSFHDTTMKILQQNAHVFTDVMDRIRGLTCIKPQGCIM